MYSIVLSFFQADMCLLILQSGRVQRVQHPVCSKPRAGEPCGPGEGRGADPGVWAAAYPTAQLSSGGPQPLQTHGRPAHRPQGACAYAELWWGFLYMEISPVPLHCLSVHVLPLDQVPYHGESRVAEKECWWLYDSSGPDGRRAAVSSLSDCSDSHSQQCLKSWSEHGEVTSSWSSKFMFNL